MMHGMRGAVNSPGDERVADEERGFRVLDPMAPGRDNAAPRP